MTLVLLIHNYYQQRGGEDAVVEAERDLLLSRGHGVATYFRHNREIQPDGFFSAAHLGLQTVWAHESYRELLSLLKRERPDVAHFHNTLPLISPAAYYACREAHVPVVQTLHNYRLLCPAGSSFREGQICEECVEHNLLRSLRHGCYRNSRAATAAVASMLAFHRARHTWTELVDCYIALTEFSRQKFIAAGLPAEKIVVKPNFVHPDPGPRLGLGELALFVGRLSPEKGLHTLLSAWKRLGNHVPLHIVGDGPLLHELDLEKSRRGLSSLVFRGRLSRESTLENIKRARFLALPSECFENFPLAIVESFACGVPVVASRLGAMAEIVADGRTGLLFTPGDAEDLAAKVEWVWTHPQEMAAMGRTARAEYEAKYTPARNCELLMQIYERAMAAHGANQNVSNSAEIRAAHV
jgi:glycosyltransferase involved in cell wall biosynthesis